MKMQGTILILVLLLRSFCTSFTTVSKHHINYSAIGMRTIAQLSIADDTYSSSQLSMKPSLIVFDLDNTIWTPELYQLRKLQRLNLTPVASKDVKLFPATEDIIDEIAKARSDTSSGGTQKWSNTKFAIASRTKSVDWAHDLISQFNLRHLFDYIEIYPGDKKAHFKSIRDKSGIPYKEMLFFDDNRDGRWGNCVPVSELGVLSVHCPNGLGNHPDEIFNIGVQRYAEWRKSDDDGDSRSIVEWDGAVTKLNSGSKGPLIGTIKMVNGDKGYGFISMKQKSTLDNGNDVFFHFNELPNGGRITTADGATLPIVNTGDELKFTMGKNKGNGKTFAENIEIIKSKSIGSTQANGTSADSEDMISMRVFSMNMPFAALLANEYKTLETRNGTMFVPYPEGTKFLLHVGKRTYPDGNRHIDVMKSVKGGMSDDKISSLKSLPKNGKGFGRGMAIAILEIGKTYETTLEERCDPDFQRKVGAFGEDSGKFATEIRRVEYLKEPVRVVGKGGIFKAMINKKYLPDGWL